MSLLRGVPVLLFAAALAACASAGGGGAARRESAPASRAAPPGSPAQSGAFEKIGVLAPSHPAALSIWPEQYAGALLVLEALPHGSGVREGDVLAKLDTRAIDEDRHHAELEAQSAAVRHQGVTEKNRLDEGAAKAQLDLAKSSLDRAQRSLEGWKQHELAFTQRSDGISKRHEQANVDDQTDELDQLERMYKADALVDATEDIVLKRSRRQLDITRTSNQLSRDRSQYRVDYDLALQTEQKEEQVRTQNEALARLVKQQEIDARARRDAELRSADALRELEEKLARLQRDRERLVLRAPRAGVLLHGASKDYRPGRSPARWERGSQLAFRQELFLVADPEPAAVALDVSDADLLKLKSGAKVRVQALGASSAQADGSVRIESHPRSNSATEAIHEAAVSLERALPGCVYGARAKVMVEAGARVEP